jgi:hypothetical protein
MWTESECVSDQGAYDGSGSAISDCNHKITTARSVLPQFFYGGRRSQAARLYLVFVLFHAKKSYLKGRVHCVSVTVNPSTNLLYGVFTLSPIAIRATEPV